MRRYIYRSRSRGSVTSQKQGLELEAKVWIRDSRESYRRMKIDQYVPYIVGNELIEMEQPCTYVTFHEVIDVRKESSSKFPFESDRSTFRHRRCRWIG